MCGLCGLTNALLNSKLNLCSLYSSYGHAVQLRIIIINLLCVILKKMAMSTGCVFYKKKRQQKVCLIPLQEVCAIYKPIPGV